MLLLDYFRLPLIGKNLNLRKKIFLLGFLEKIHRMNQVIDYLITDPKNLT